MSMMDRFLRGIAHTRPFVAVANPVPKAAEFHLDDPKVVEELYKKYAYLTNPGPLYVKTGEAFAVLAGIFAHKAFSDASGEEPSARVRNQRNAGDMTRMALTGTYMVRNIKDMGKEGVRLSFNLPNISAEIFGLGTSPNSAQALAWETGQKLIRVMFPDFDPAKIRMSGATQALNMKRELPLEAIASLSAEGIPKLDINEWDRNYRGMVKFFLNLSEISLIGENDTDHLTAHNDYRLDITVRVEITFPREYALWSTSSIGNDFVPTTFWMVQRRLHEWHTSTDPAGKAPPARVMHPDRPSRIAREMTAAYNLKPIPRVNKEGFCSTPKGDILYVPSQELSGSSWTKVLQDCVDPETGNIQTEALCGRHVATDWTLNKLFMTDAEGQQHIVDLTGARPLTPTVIGHLMSQNVDNDMLGAMIKLARSVVNGLNFEAFGLDFGKRQLTWENMIDVPLFEDGEENPAHQHVNEMLFLAGREFARAYTGLVSSSLPLYSQYNLRFYLAMYGIYAPKRPEYANALAEQVALNRAAVAKPDREKGVTLHDMQGVDGVMPHQAGVHGVLQTHPKRAMYDISAGGGKSWCYIDDITQLMMAGKVHKPAIIMPRNIMAQFSREIVRFTKGSFRPFNINARVWRVWMRRVGLGRVDTNPTAILQLLNRQPKNTIYVIDFDWLTKNGQKIEFGEEEVFYPQAQYIAQLGFDYVALDESQRTKNLDTGRTIATAHITSMAAVNPNTGGEGYIRIGSGTIFHNTAKDILGQMAQLEPTALGELGRTIKENDRVNLSDLPELRDRLNSFCRRIVVPRRAWAHLLPPIIERVWPVDLTKNQQHFYEDIMKREMAKIASDPKIKKLLKAAKDGSEGAAAALEVLFNRYFSKVEIWLNAPNSDFAQKQLGVFFANMTGITEADMVSRKVAAIDYICEQHFNGAKGVDLGGEDGVQDLAPSPNKILVVSYNKAVSEHIYEHMRYQSVALHYRAGDDKVIEEFANNDKYKILVADETTISEGLNFQMCDRVIRVQSMWTPGAQEQTMARVWRPDVPDKDGKMKYQRDRIFLDWLVCEPSIEVPKMARMIGKQVENGIVQEVDSNKNLQKVVAENEDTFAAVKRIKMSLDMIQDKQLQTRQALMSQFAAYKLYKDWERGEFRSERKRLIKETEERVGRKVRPSELAALSMIKAKSTATAEFAAPNKFQCFGYTPWIEGYHGYNPTKMNLIPLVISKDEESSEDGDESDMTTNVDVKVGDPVVTQFGPGYVTTSSGYARISVVIPGFSNKQIRFYRWDVSAPADDRSRTALLLMLRAAKNGMPTIKLDDKTGSLSPTSAGVPADTVESYLKQAETYHKKNKESLPGLTPKELKVYKGLETKDANVDEDEGEDNARPKTLKDAVRRAKEAENKKVPPKGISRSPGIKKTDVYVRPTRPAPKKAEAPSRSPIKAPPGRSAKIGPTETVEKRTIAPINLNDMDIVKKQKEANLDRREGEAILFNGLVCLITSDGGERDAILLKNGFDRIGASFRIRVKNPKAYDALVDLLSRKYVIPRGVKRALDQFGEIYHEQRSNMAYLKAKRLPFHAQWVRDQRKKAIDKKEIRPWPVVENRAVYLYINHETCPAANKLPNLTLPTGVLRAQKIGSAMIAMVGSVSNAKQLMRNMRNKGISFDNEDEILDEMRAFKSS